VDTDGLVAHPRTIKEIMPAITVERKLMEYHTTSRRKAKASPRVARAGAVECFGLLTTP